MKRMLFVDDEPRILDGIRRMLRPMKGEWECEFVTSGPDALQLLEKEPFDVIVTDMRMPGMDGADLLALVRDRFPTVVRIVLSGYSEKEAIFKLVKPAHQYLSKPCDAQTLMDALERACSVQEWIANDSIRKVVSGLECLPSMPAQIDRIVAELISDDVSVARIAEIVSHDIGMTARILQLVNSGFFSLRQHVTDIAQAVNLLGLDTVRVLVFSLRIFSQFSLSQKSGLDLTEAWCHSVRVGLFSKVIAMVEGAEASVINDSFAAGLVHDVGKVILAAHFSGQYRKAMLLSKGERMPLTVAETQIFGANHSDVGGYFVSLWGLPTPIVRAVGYHHENCFENGGQFTSLMAVYGANIIEHQNRPGEWSGLDNGEDKYSHVGPRLRSWRDACMKTEALTER